ncbi:hypothetical protein GT037_007590 [Alternaria burnsii]|uniref:Uncharacterized protein n=1 Tax=Alternaria burnsii TaxID=1187904 RepID=A0A8H7ECN6_9PLEO|nr:uncharacterized protein GT037_007590 [Alternaria burnsii]KAF7674830.1 hypothetical protein GT037_007590 [Alternaria burnsii]
MPAFLHDTSAFKAWEVEPMCGIQRRNFARLVRAWGACHRQLLLLNLCERTAFFVTHDLAMNEAFLDVLHGSELHECALKGRPSPASHDEVRTEDERGCGRRNPAQPGASITDQSSKERDLKRLDDLR